MFILLKVILSPNECLDEYYSLSTIPCTRDINSEEKKMNIPLTFELEKFVQGDYRDNHYICH